MKFFLQIIVNMQIKIKIIICNKINNMMNQKQDFEENQDVGNAKISIRKMNKFQIRNNMNIYFNSNKTIM